MAESHSLAALDAAVASWNHGRGAWAQAKAETRIAKVEELMTELKASKRDEIINVLMWEICKTKADATKEFDRTMDYIAATISTYKAMLATDSSFVQKEGVLAQIKRAPLGVMLNLGPFNYPFNETCEHSRPPPAPSLNPRICWRHPFGFRSHTRSHACTHSSPSQLPRSLRVHASFRRLHADPRNPHG